MNQKKTKKLRQHIRDWRETIYDKVVHAFDVMKPLKGEYSIILNEACGRARYQAMKTT